MRNRLFASLFVVVALVFGITNSASADQWDYIYGEDPTNANNVSGNQDLRVDPLGGVFIVGYFYGMFEGLNSNGSWSKFLQHRNVNGTVDWTIPYESSNDNSIPAAPSKFVVDGNGDVLISGCCSDGAAITVSRSGTLTRSVGTITVGAAGHISSCTAFIPSAAGGFVGLCNKHLLKYDNMMNQLWDVDVTLWIGTNNGPALEETSILKGSGDTLWLASSFNSQNLTVDPTSLPQSLRPAIGLSHFSLSTGGYISSFKHYGIIGPIDKKSVAISDRALWIYTQSSGTGNQSFRISVFDSSDGHLVGNVDPRLGIYGQNYDGNISTAVAWASRNGVPTDTGGMCMANALALSQRIAWINGGNSNDCWKAIVTNDGRRLALTVDKNLFFFEIGGELPLIDHLISYQSFAGNISGIDADNLGNIYVVGSTFETRVVQSNELREPAGNIQTQSLSANRAFISRNPMGRISLDVLPRTPLRIKVAGTNGVPATGVGAVSMNVTVTSPDGEGFITVYPCDSKPDASNLNYTLDQTVPNAVIAPVSSTGDVCFYTNTETHLLADINGYFPTGQGFTAAGPARVFDTRAASGQGLRTVNKVKIGGAQEVRVKMTDLAGFTPSTGVGAVSLNITATGTTADDFGGYVTVYPCGNRPNASSINFVSGQTVPNAVIAPVSASGEVCFYARGTTDLIVDINGYFLSGAGFTPTTPTRIADTRSGSDQGVRTVTKTKVGGDTTLKVKFTDIAGLTPSSGVGAVSLNVTATGTTADKFGGYVTVYPCGAIPNASNLNFVSGQIVPNAVIAPVSASGEVCFYARGTTDLIVDLNGYFLTGAGFTPMSPVRLFDTR
ncbi:MAG: hypothetical protein WCK23_10140 [Actinomycetes bacterium]